MLQQVALTWKTTADVANKAVQEMKSSKK